MLDYDQLCVLASKVEGNTASSTTVQKRPSCLLVVGVSIMWHQLESESVGKCAAVLSISSAGFTTGTELRRVRVVWQHFSGLRRTDLTSSFIACTASELKKIAGCRRPCCSNCSPAFICCTARQANPSYAWAARSRTA